MGGAVSSGQNNDDLIDNLMQADYIKTPSIEKVFRAVDRAEYFLPQFRSSAYMDLAWKSGHLHISAPCIYSEVMEGLCLQPGMSFLNLGSGTGYFSTMVGLILGSNGINHGIEIHEDVIDYARKKVVEFKKLSGALDEYDFCEPQFKQGNCLCLSSDYPLYDRVYCGAACPEEYEGYMKNLIKIGGILVMPLNEHLLQITRVGETTWDVKCLLPATFATLIRPHSGKPPVEPFSIEMPSLQYMCRSIVRNILRRNVMRVKPTNNKKTSSSYNKAPKKKRALRKLMVPLFDSDTSDDEHRVSVHRISNAANSSFCFFAINVSPLEEEQQRNNQRGGRDSLTDNSSESNTNRTTTDQESRDDDEELPASSEGEKMEVDEPNAEMEELLSSPKRLKVPDNTRNPSTERVELETPDSAQKRNEKNMEAFADEGQCCLCDNKVSGEGKGLFEQVMEAQEHNTNRGTENLVDSDVMGSECNSTADVLKAEVQEISNLLKNKETGKAVERKKFDSGLGDEILEPNGIHSSTDEEGMDDARLNSSSSDNGDQGGGRQRNREGSGERRNRVIYNGFHNRCVFNSSSADSSTDNDTDDSKSKQNMDGHFMYQSPYTELMTSKIQELPLPGLLKNFLNYNRDFV